MKLDEEIKMLDKVLGVFEEQKKYELGMDWVWGYLTGIALGIGITLLWLRPLWSIFAFVGFGFLFVLFIEFSFWRWDRKRKKTRRSYEGKKKGA